MTAKDEQTLRIIDGLSERERAFLKPLTAQGRRRAQQVYLRPTRTPTPEPRHPNHASPRH